MLAAIILTQNAQHSLPQNIFPTPPRASATGAGCGKPSPFSRCSYKPHLRNQPSLPPTPTPLHRQGSFRPFLLPIYISKPTYYYRYYYLGRRQPQWPQHMAPELSTAAANSAGTKRQMCKLPANWDLRDGAAWQQTPEWNKGIPLLLKGVISRQSCVATNTWAQ